jgi:predicted small secreted protein
MMKINLLPTLLASVVVLAMLLPGCNTIEGMGKDVQAAGRGVEKAADNVKKKF